MEGLLLDLHSSFSYNCNTKTFYTFYKLMTENGHEAFFLYDGGSRCCMFYHQGLLPFWCNYNNRRKSLTSSSVKGESTTLVSSNREMKE